MIRVRSNPDLFGQVVVGYEIIVPDHECAFFDKSRIPIRTNHSISTALVEDPQSFLSNRDSDPHSIEHSFDLICIPRRGRKHSCQKCVKSSYNVYTIFHYLKVSDLKGARSCVYSSRSFCTIQACIGRKLRK